MALVTALLLHCMQHEPKAEGDELIRVLCDAYIGPNKPEACNHYKNNSFYVR